MGERQAFGGPAGLMAMLQLSFFRCCSNIASGKNKQLQKLFWTING